MLILLAIVAFCVCFSVYFASKSVMKTRKRFKTSVEEEMMVRPSPSVPLPVNLKEKNENTGGATEDMTFYDIPKQPTVKINPQIFITAGDLSSSESEDDLDVEPEIRKWTSTAL